MSQSIRDQAFLIRSVNYQDSHRILSFLTANNSRVDLIAYGARLSKQRFGGMLDFLHELHIEYHPSRSDRLSRLDRCKLQQTYLHIQKNYDQIHVALAWCQLLHQTIPVNSPILGTFNLLQEALGSLGEAMPAWVDVGFRFQLLSQLGYHLEFQHCVGCQNQAAERHYFSLKLGGLQCGSCYLGQEGEGLELKFPLRFWPSFQKRAGAEIESILLIRRWLDQAFQEFLGLRMENYP